MAIRFEYCSLWDDQVDVSSSVGCGGEARENLLTGESWKLILFWNSVSVNGIIIRADL